MWLVLFDDGDPVYNGLYYETFKTEEEAREFAKRKRDEFIYITKVLDDGDI